MPKVDLETFNNKYSEGEWSDNSLAKAAGCSRATLRNIREVGTAHPETIRRIARAFGITADCLMIHDPSDRRRAVFDSSMEEYKTLLRSVLHSDQFALWAEQNGGMFNANFLTFAYQFKKPELDSLHLSPNGRSHVHEELCREGLLEKHPARGTDGGERVIYCCRTWSKEQAEDNLDLRIGIEKLAAERTIRLLVRNPVKHRIIRDELKGWLGKMEKEIPNLKKTGNERTAMVLLKIDAKFHKAWAGDAPDYRAAMSRAVFGHGQIIHQYISQIRLASAKKDKPKNMPTLASLALSSYEDLLEIFQSFDAIKSPDDSVQITRLLQLIEQHPRKNWDRMAKIARFNDRNR